jgi:hypothetical protein
MRIDWTNIGARFTEGKRDRIVAITNEIDAATAPVGQDGCWLRVPKPGEPALSVGMMPGEGIKAAIRELRLPKVTHIAISAALAPFGLYGMRAHYKGDQQVDVWVVDDGCGITPIMMKVYEHQSVDMATVLAV